MGVAQTITDDQIEQKMTRIIFLLQNKLRMNRIGAPLKAQKGANVMLYPFEC